MRKLLVILVILASILLLGCPGVKDVEPIPSEEPSGVTPGLPIEPGEEPPPGDTWVYPGIVTIRNMGPGEDYNRAEYYISVHNGKQVSCPFEVKFRNPSYTKEGYVLPPSSAESWVSIENSYITLGPRETKEIFVVLQIPDDLKEYPDKWEYWISVMDKSQSGLVVTELCIRCLVDMK